MDVYPKFLIIGDNLVIAKCTYHKQLIKEDNAEPIKGGGLWYRGDNGEFVINGTTMSGDYGKARFQDIENCVKLGNVFTNKYFTHPIRQYDICYFNGSETINISKLNTAQ